ncbi:polysaccharide biosynthesis protein [Sulfitobacter sp. SK012]|uniref:polysaccharide biosynthesis/export family protein n=1 Tax=Sulfitobacter sp. SK012 TaxID=1389005 RepID=UPI000E0C4796|nr:polysaccharide biosynthesis/export family protein [Sulfitobacter sp. SK012]AXI48446.1 polysaccharide biosynthesis protein [Sulfitobacter sp. SK012]
MGFFFPRITCVLLALSLAACGSLPRGAALEAEVLRGANNPEADFAVYPVTKAFLPTAAKWPLTGEEHRHWINSSAGSIAQVIQPGDTLDVFIWDSGENSLLTAPDQRVATLSGMRVSEGGSIFVPYIGKIRVSGRTPDSARQLVQRQLEAIVPSAQVQLQMSEGRVNSIDLVGGVAIPGNVKLPDQNFTVLAAISAAGGVRDTLNNPQVKIVRGGNIYGTSISRLYDDPSLNTRLQGGDKVIVEADERYFLSLGATGLENQFPFNRDSVSALDALSTIGGLNDLRADPKGLLILREYPASAVQTDGGGPGKQRVIFTLDLTKSDGLFSARNFAINSGDVLLATESPVASAQTIFRLIGSTAGLVAILN